MTDAMQVLFNYLQEGPYRAYLPSDYYWHGVRLLETREASLLEACFDRQRELLEQYQEAAACQYQLELEAMFQAAWTLSREMA